MYNPTIYNDSIIMHTWVSIHFLPVGVSTTLPKKWIGNIYSGLAFSHGFPNLSQSSGSSVCNLHYTVNKLMCV